jgi:hypothetical protein
MFDRLRRLFRTLRGIFQRRHPQVRPSTPTAAPAVVGVAAEAIKNAVETAVVQMPRQAEKDKLRRRLERNRLRYDVFVKPNGPEPEKQTRAPGPPRAKLEILPPADALSRDCEERLIAEETKRGDLVLIKEREIYGEFTFRDTILDQLDRYFVYLKRMKKRDPDSFGFYKKVGITLLPLSATFMTGLQFRGELNLEKEKRVHKIPTLPAWFKQQRPAFGCFAFGTNSYVEKSESDETNKHRVWHPRFMYFVKYQNPPPEMQPMAGGDIYKLTVWFDPCDKKLAKRKSAGWPIEFGIFVNSDGNDVTLLKELKTVNMPLSPKRDRRGGKRGLKRVKCSGTIPVRAWGIPKSLVDWAKDHDETPDHFFVDMFCGAVTNWEFAGYSMIKVHVEKDDMIAVFGVDVHRLGYFFQDRDIELTGTGTKKRIFHIVRPHERMTKEGKKAVPFHFRGLREFDWAGHHVRITVPEPASAIRECNIGCTDSAWRELEEEWLTMPQLADRLVEHEQNFER